MAANKVVLDIDKISNKIITTLSLDVRAPLGKQIIFDNGNSYISNTYGNFYIRSNANEKSKVIIQGNTHPDVTVGAATGKFYTELNKPTSADVGALSLTGGTVTGDVRFNSGNTTRLSLGSGSDYYVERSPSGLTLASGTINPKVRVNNTDYDIYHVGNKPTAVDVGTMTTAQINTELNKKLNLSGGTLTGTLTIQASAPQIWMDETDNSSSKFGFVVDGATIRLNKDTSSGLAIFKYQTDGTFAIANPVSSTSQYNHASALTRKDYVDSRVSTGLPLSGGTMTGPIIVANTKGAIKVDNQKSISFQDQANTMYHLFAEGNYLKVKHGNAGENQILQISAAGVESSTTVFARGGLISQDSTSTKWLSMETPANANPYIAVRATGDAVNRVAMTFEKGAIRVATDTMVAPSMLIENNGGLVLAPNTSRTGVTWGMGIDASTREFNIHRYLDGVWQQLPVTIATDGTFKANSGLYATTLTVANNATVSGSIRTGSIDVGGYISLTSAGNTLLEFHTPGRTAAMIYKGPEGNLRFVTSNGSAGETALRMQLDTGGNLVVAGSVNANGNVTGVGLFDNGNRVYSASNPIPDGVILRSVVNGGGNMDIGSFAMITVKPNLGLQGPGTVLQGTQIAFSNAEGTNFVPCNYGTWRLMGVSRAQSQNGDGWGSWNVTLAQRIT